MNKFSLFITIVAGLIFCLTINAASHSEVIINEVAWMGSTNSANDEWIELFNQSNNQIDLSYWTLKSANEKLKINLQGIILPKGYYLLERTDDSSVPTVNADLIYKGALNNSGMSLGLYDNLDNLIDKLDYPTAWPAGDNITKQTMERITAGWQTSKNYNGTPKNENSLGVIKKSPTNNSNLKTSNDAIILPDDEKSDNKIDTSSSIANQSLASIENNLNKEQDKLSAKSLFLISLGTIISLAIIILIVKIKLNK